MYGFCPKTPPPPSCQNFVEFRHNQELMQMTKTFLPFNNKIVSQFSKRRLCKAKQTYCDENVGNFEEDKREREGETRLKTVEAEGSLRKDQDGQLCLTLGLGRCSGCQCSVTTKKLDPTTFNAVFSISQIFIDEYFVDSLAAVLLIKYFRLNVLCYIPCCKVVLLEQYSFSD